MVYVGGVYQPKGTYSVSGTTLTFSEAPPSATGNIEVNIGQVTTTTDVGANAVNSAAIAANAVGSAEIAANSVDSSEIATGSIDTIHIGDDQVTNAKLAVNSVSAVELAGNSVTSTQIAANQVAASEIATGSVGTIHIANNAVLTQHIDDNQITADQLADDSVGADQLAANSVVSASIVNGSIVSADIAANTIATSNIADNAIDGTKIASNSILTRHIDDNQITGDQLADDLVLSGTGAIRLPDGTTGQRPGSPAAGMFRYNTTDGKFEGYTTEWGEIGGGSGASAMETNNFTGDGSTTAFTVSSSVSDEDNLIVFIEGVYQNKADYVASGTTITFDVAPANGRKIVVQHIRASIAGSNCIANSFTGDGSTTAFTLTQNPASENNTQVFLDGVYQLKNSYAVSGTTLTFDAAPANSTAIEVMMFTSTDLNTLPASFVSGLTEVTAVGADHLMIFDATDGALKKSLVSDVIEQAAGITSSADATAITIDSSEM